MAIGTIAFDQADLLGLFVNNALASRPKLLWRYPGRQWPGDFGHHIVQERRPPVGAR